MLVRFLLLLMMNFVIFLRYKEKKSEFLQLFLKNLTIRLTQIDFEKVPDLVARRAVYLKEGKAYVPVTQQLSLVMYEFRQRLAKALEVRKILFCSNTDRFTYFNTFIYYLFL